MMKYLNNAGPRIWLAVVFFLALYVLCAPIHHESSSHAVRDLAVSVVVLALLVILAIGYALLKDGKSTIGHLWLVLGALGVLVVGIIIGKSIHVPSWTLHGSYDALRWVVAEFFLVCSIVAPCYLDRNHRRVRASS